MKILAGAVSLVVLFLIAGWGLAVVGGGDVVFKAGKARDVVFSHGKHVEDLGLKCTECHDALYAARGKNKNVTMAQMREGKSCGACHNGEMAFDVKGNCSRCHKK